MFYVYIMFSEVNGDIYIGSTANVEARLARHNSGKVRSTKGNRPWRLLEIHEYDTRVGAMRMELIRRWCACPGIRLGFAGKPGGNRLERDHQKYL
ncbi:MAG: Excinuclease ABC C subunit domain protein [Parcubacteria group bacterium GW2011_GWA2_42_80]|nr:MAG: Excinuclease ABC C subunit domain protein [Parcubacteria group bacterium GW2011_GWA2_42_80]